MSYRVYIKKDYKAVVYRVPDWWGFDRVQPWLLGTGIVMSVGFAAPMISLGPGATHTVQSGAGYRVPVVQTENGDAQQSAQAIAPTLSPIALPVPASPPEPYGWTRVKVARGDSLATIFSRLGFNSNTLDAVLTSTDEAARLNRLLPGQTLELQIAGEELLALRFEPNARDALEIERNDGVYVGSLVTSELEVRIHRSEAEIRSSLFLAGQDAGLSDRLIMDLVAIFGWDIDFALDIWEGDQFKVVYEEYYKENTKVADGPILAAEFSNRGKVYRAVRYTSPDRQTGYFSETGASMRKAFLRTPLNFTRISSGFDLHRYHPILNTIRAHRGVDYAAPTGTSVRATGDGTVMFLGRKGGYGNTIILRHGTTYSTVYAHMSRFVIGLKRGARVRQGDVIGFVGMTGLATGPHLHYEFQVNGVHRNPLTIPLPRTEGIPANQVQEFESATAPLLARLDENTAPAPSMVVLREDTASAPAVP